jgi:hypothetical protein
MALIAQEGELNSSSNNSEVKAAEQNVIIEYEYEPEPDDYNYEAPDTPIDEEEFRQLTYTGNNTNNTKVMIAVVIIMVAALIGGVIGLVIGGIVEDNNDIKRKSTIASTVKRIYDTKIEGFNAFAAAYQNIANGDYNAETFDKFMMNLSQYDFMLDMSSDISSEIILLNGDSRANPVKNLREYSADTMLLTQLLSIHRNETHVDEEEIVALMEKGGSEEVTYAMSINPDSVYYLGKTAPREQFANGVISIYTLREEIDNDEALSNIYESYKSDKGWSAAQREMRDYQPAKGENVGELDLPNRIMYEVANRRGDLNYVFADEIVLVDRKLLFGKAANALDRYKQRSMQISNLIENIKKESTSISGDLELFMTPEAKAAAEMAKTKPVAKEEGKTPAAS